MHPLTLSPDRLFPADPTTRSIARALYAEVANLPIISPHGHTDPAWFATNAPWSNATELLLAPDHYLFRMLYSQGVSLDALCVPSKAGMPATDPFRDGSSYFPHSGAEFYFSHRKNHSDCAEEGRPGLAGEGL